MPKRALVIHPDDNVGNLIGPGSKGEEVQCAIEGREGTTVITLVSDIPSNHKFAFVDINEGDAILKYGLNIGRATSRIQRGEYVHVHNVESNRGRGDLESS
jgi:altronate dehydratase small subunit